VRGATRAEYRLCIVDSILEIPAFARLSDYIGWWAIDPLAAVSLCRLVSSIDLSTHIQEHRQEPKALVEKFAGPEGKSIAVLKLTGLLMKGQSSLGGTSTVQARREIRAAANDPEVGGIVLAIDSPGGTVAGTADLAEDVRVAAKRKPVMAHVDDLGASAAYWVASQANRITANCPTCMVGSIGTIQVVHDVSAAAEREGVKVIALTTGPLKGTGVPGTKITDEQISHLQGMVNAIQGNFDAAVQKGRGLTAKQLAAVKHGGAILAPAAQEAGLIDAIQPLSKTMADMQTAIKAGASAVLSRPTGGLPVIQRRRLPMISHGV